MPWGLGIEPRRCVHNTCILGLIRTQGRPPNPYASESNSILVSEMVPTRPHPYQMRGPNTIETLVEVGKSARAGSDP